MINQDNSFKNRDGYDGNYRKDKTTYNKKTWQEASREDKEWANTKSNEMAEKVGKNMKDLIAYLDVQTKFEMYSASNALLILNQKPEATYLREYSKWKDDGYEIKDSNDKVIIIKREQVEKPDGSIGTFFNARNLYDVSNTNAPALQMKKAPDQQTIIQTLLNGSKIDVEVVDDLGKDILAKYDFDRKIMQVCRGQNANSKIQDIVMELAKIEFKVNEVGISDTEKNNRKFKSTCVSYMFCKKFNIDFPKDKFAELPNYLSGDAKQIKAELETIKDTYINITDRMYGSLNRERNTKQKEQVR